MSLYSQVWTETSASLKFSDDGRVWHKIKLVVKTIKIYKILEYFILLFITSILYTIYWDREESINMIKFVLLYAVLKNLNKIEMRVFHSKILSLRSLYEGNIKS